MFPDTEELIDEHTKAELRAEAQSHGMSIPRGARKRYIARMLSEPVACEGCGDVIRMGVAEDLEDQGGYSWVMCPACAGEARDEGWTDL